MKRKYRVILPIDFDGTVHQHGATVELDTETAKLYSHALMAVEEKDDEKETHANGGNS